MQVLGRSFNDATVLRVSQAYEQATDWHRQHPRFREGAEAPVLTPPASLAEAADQTDTATREACVYAAQRVGLTLDEQFAQLLEGAPYALRMVERLRRDDSYAHEPANIFRFPASF